MKSSLISKTSLDTKLSWALGMCCTSQCTGESSLCDYKMPHKCLISVVADLLGFFIGGLTWLSIRATESVNSILSSPQTNILKTNEETLLIFLPEIHKSFTK